jgi:hypothetical protein
MQLHCVQSKGLKHYTTAPFKTINMKKSVGQALRYEYSPDVDRKPPKHVAEMTQKKNYIAQRQTTSTTKWLSASSRELL